MTNYKRAYVDAAQIRARCLLARTARGLLERQLKAGDWMSGSFLCGPAFQAIGFPSVASPVCKSRFDVPAIRSQRLARWQSLDAR